MATTSLWEIHQRLDKVIEYTTNSEKTKNKEYAINCYKDLHNAIEYTKANYKTEKQLYVTGINCNEETALKEMIATKKQYGKENGILAYHGFQSFVEGEVTPKIAHEIGIKLAEELWGDKYEVIVSTHLNTNHIHNHFVINSVSFVDGKKYRNNRESYAYMRRTSDDICREYKLNVLKEKPCGKLKINYERHYNSYIQKSDFHTIAKDDIDFAIGQAYSYKNFIKILEQMDYIITIRANKISICRPPYKRNIRIERAFGEEYSIANIEERIMNTEMKKIPFPEVYRKSKRYVGITKKVIRKDRGSLYRLYLYYCYLLKVFPKNKNRTKLSAEMRQEVKKMDEISNEIKFLCRNNIKSTQELFLYKESVMTELKTNMKKRNSLRRKRQKEKEPKERQKLCNDILDLSNLIVTLKQEVIMCEKIEERTIKMKNNIKETEDKENQKGKERKKDEFIRFS